MTTAAAATARLRAALRDRAGLAIACEEGFVRAVRSGDEAAEAWAAGALGLLNANAGAACLTAFFRLDAAPALLGLMAPKLAEICLHAGAGPALACLEAWERLGRPDFWAGLVALARGAPDCIPPLLAEAGGVVQAIGAEEFAGFVALGLKAGGRDKARRLAFFTLQDPLARRALAGSAGGFAVEERRLKLFLAALSGRAPALRPLPAAPGLLAPRRASLADGVVLLPATFPGVPAAAQGALLRAAAAHALAHLMAGTGMRQKVGSLKPLQLAVIGLIEDARVETLALRRFPGLRRLWAPHHVAAPEGFTVPDLLARLARALFDHDYADPHGFIKRGRALFAAADLTDQGISRRIGGLLGNDLGQMRLQFSPRTHVIEPAYRDDNLGLWDFGAQAAHQPEMIDLMVEAARLRQEAGEGRNDPRGEANGLASARAAAASPQGAVLARYPEWDPAQGIERPDWTCVRAAPVPPGDPRRLEAAQAAVPDLRRRVDRLVRAARPGRPARLKRQPDGMDLDLDAVIDAQIARTGGELGDGRWYRSTALRLRDLATSVLIDVSQSTRDGGVLEVERLAVGLLGEAMARLGDAFSLLAFASDGREQVRLLRVKDFSEPFGEAARARLAGLTPGLSTRLGAALRHAGAELGHRRNHRRLLLVLTDGEPSDIDVTDARELVEDARRAVLQLRARGIDVFAIILGGAGRDHAARIFGRAGQVALRRLEDLPARLTELYFRLSHR